MGDVTTSEPLKWVALDEEKLSGSLAPGSVSVWCVTAEDIDDTEVVQQGASCLTASEVARATKFVKPKDRHHFIVGRWMLRHFLGAYTLTDPNEIALVINKNGRPELLGFNQSRTHFSLSHTDGLVACAFTSGFEIGIDVERIHRSRFDMGVARNYFSVEAYRDILEAPECSQPERFFDHWVLIEACAKARGTGLVLPASGSFVFGNADRSYIRFIPSLANDSTALSFWLLEPAFEYRMAVAVAGEPSGPPIVRRLGPDGSHNMVCRAVASSATFRST